VIGKFSLVRGKVPLVFAVFGSAAACSVEVQTASTPVVELRADTNRNGKLDWEDATEIAEKTTWDAKHGAIFLANIDDDSKRCSGTNSSGGPLSDVDLPGCNDATDTEINGDADALDLAPLGTRPWPQAPIDAVGHLAVDDASVGKVHLFIQRSGAWTFFDPTADTLSSADLRDGVSIGLEGTDIVRDADVWNGRVTVTFTVSSGGKDTSDSVLLRVAPVVLRHHLAPEEQVFVSKFPGDTGSTETRTALKAAIAARYPSASSDFLFELDGEEQLGRTQPYYDQWIQDYMEIGYASMPATDGKQQKMNIFLRSANVYEPKSAKSPLRPAGKVVFIKFRGPDSAAVQQYDAGHDEASDSLNSFGNTETIPPFSDGAKSYPLGRLLRGSIKSFAPDRSFSKLLDAQEVQPTVNIDTSWLFVGHVDETISFVKAPTPRGWVALVNDPALAREMLQAQVDAGKGDTPLFTGRKWIDDTGAETPAETTIAKVLANTDVMSESASTASHVQSQLAILKAETGLTDAEIVRVPYLHEPVQGASVAYQPGTVNGLVLADDTFAAPEPHGPVIDGKDIFKVQLEGALAKIGVKVAWIEDWDLYHREVGEVHCGTNSKRGLLPNERWWESGR
jgi:protein-arginine deiminase